MDGSWTSLWDWSPVIFFRRHASLGAFQDQVFGIKIDMPSKIEWDRMLVKYPLRPKPAEWKVMRQLTGELI